MSATPDSMQFILQSDQVPVLLVQPEGPNFGWIQEQLEKDRQIRVVRCASSSEAVSVVRRLGLGLILAYASTQETIVKHITLMKLLSSEIREGKVRVVALTPIRASVLGAKLESYGCAETIIEPLPAKTLWIKMELHLKQMKLLRQPAGFEMAESSSTLTQPAKGSGQTVRLGPALEIAEDCWLLREGSALRRDGIWRVALQGPRTSQGSWIQESGLSASTLRWKWQVDAEPAPAGAWYFTGKKPTHEEGQWIFEALSPQLEYLAEDGAKSAKFRVDDEGALWVARDSAVALKKIGEVRVSRAQRKMPIDGLDAKLPPDVLKILSAIDRDDNGASDTQATTPAAMGPLALAFLLSESIRKPGLSTQQVGQKFCSFVTQAYHDLEEVRVELWSFRKSLWQCAGTQDGTDGMWKGALEKVQDELKASVQMLDPKTVAGPIHSAEGELLGSLVLSGEGVVTVDPDRIFDLGSLASGLLKGEPIA